MEKMWDASRILSDREGYPSSTDDS